MKKLCLSPILPSLCLAIISFIALALYLAGTSFKSPCCRFYPLQPLTADCGSTVPNVIRSRFHSVGYQGDSTYEKQLKREARHETRGILRFHMQTAMSWVGAYRRFEGTRSHNLPHLKYLLVVQ